LLDHIRTEAWTLIHPEDAGYAANDPSDHAANDGPDQKPVTSFRGPPFNEGRRGLQLHAFAHRPGFEYMPYSRNSLSRWML
jgi:hypothetical protein